MSSFELDSRIARDSELLLTLDLCQVRIQNDSRWPWLVLVPQRAGMVENFDLPDAEQALFHAEIAEVAAALKKAVKAHKMNIAGIGNIVRQLHVHIVARFEDDPNWPGPVWGYGTAAPYDEAAMKAFRTLVIEALS